MREAAIEVSHLQRTYKTTIGVIRRKSRLVEAVSDISFRIEPGELFGLVGPNGAGKTTTVKMLTTLLIPTSGKAKVLGYDVVQNPRLIQARIGFIYGGDRGLYWRLSGIDNLRYFASLYHVDPSQARTRIDYLLDLVGLFGRGEERVEGYSRGMRQRLHIARALLHDPEVLFLDEPTIGLDPVGARELRAVIRNLQAEAKTILLTTHYMFEADELCQRVGVINHGKIIALDTPKRLKQTVRDLSVIEIDVYGIRPETLAIIRTRPDVDSVSIQERGQKQTLLVHSPSGSQALPAVLEALSGMRVGSATLREPTLEDAYVRLVGGEA
ncbi:MAG: ABC transporter ATP-binding protein [Anaerolineales bacterium]|nr:ABC transporter ATP-binding protein [Anaerolineales bacterium]